MEPLRVRIGHSTSTDPATAVAEVRAAVDQPGLKVVLIFCAASYDLEALGREIQAAFGCTVIGCTTAGQIGPAGYQRGGITAAGLASDHLSATPLLIEPLTECHRRAAEAAARARALVDRLAPGRRAFGFLLADGLCRSEEALVATLYQALVDVPIVGGSAGDDLSFRRTAVYWEGRFLSNAAVFTVFETTHPFSTFKLQHFQPSGRRVVITAADTSARRVLEIDGYPAAEAYAAAVGVPEGELTAAAFSANPLMLRIGDDYYIRSIYKIGPNRSLEFFCAIDEGLVLSIGRAGDPVEALKQGLAEATRGLGRPAVVLGCDCILRRLELETKGLDGTVGQVLADWKVVGFSTFGEQLNAVHINQTFTGLALGE